MEKYSKKNIYKKYVGVDNKLNNYSGFNHLHNTLIRLLEQLILTIGTSFICKSIIFYFFDILSFNSNSKIVYNYTHLLLLLNQLQYLIVKEIFDYTIKNKRKMYLDLN